MSLLFLVLDIPLNSHVVVVVVTIPPVRSFFFLSPFFLSLSTTSLGATTTYRYVLRQLAAQLLHLLR